MTTTSLPNGVPTNPKAKAAHVNMMTDTIIANMPAASLRAIMRSLLGADASITSSFHALVAQHLAATQPTHVPVLFDGQRPTRALWDLQRRYRCLMGCGAGFESVRALQAVVEQVGGVRWDGGEQVEEEQEEEEEDVLALEEVLAVVDGDIVQAVTAVQKESLTVAGMRVLTAEEREVLIGLRAALLAYKAIDAERGREFAFERGLTQLLMLKDMAEPVCVQLKPTTRSAFASSSNALETVQLGSATLPRMFKGLWQFSSPAWGTASRMKINRHFRKHVDAGFVAYDMADHYGDAEVTFGQFRSAQPDANKIYCATKVCYFEPVEITKEAVQASVSERLANINAESVELLQFHWQNYDDSQYIKAARLIQEDPRVQAVGLVNFDTPHMDEILESGISVVSNQVQFSLIDLRPTFKMARSCRRYNVKLLTYGSLCGGFLADKWFNKPAPSLFDAKMTPSHRKYLEMITIWGGWSLFQELLSVLSRVGTRYHASISNAAVRWVLDHDYVGAVIVGARMGISEHTQENLQAFRFRLDERDQADIDAVLRKCCARDVFEAMGDCGAEYRQ